MPGGRPIRLDVSEPAEHFAALAELAEANQAINDFLKREDAA